MRHIQWRVKSEIIIIINRWFSWLTFFSSNQNDTSRRTWTINRRRSSIFQNRNILNILWINSINIPFHSINQHQRRYWWAFTNSSCTTNIEFFVTFQWTTITTCWNIHARNNSLQSFNRRTNRTCRNLFRSDSRYSTGHIHFLLRSKCNDYHFIQSLGIIF